MSKTKFLVNNAVIELTQKDYVAAGGEGTIYKRGNLAYKIYHEPRKCIAPAKIDELKVIASKNVLAPLNVIYDYDTNKPCGFTMQAVSNFEFLCKLFTRSFRDRNNVSPADIVDLIKIMQQTLQNIHKNKILVVDFNEMNFLIDAALKLPYFIDVDSYQTPSFKATALMESVRDRKSPKNIFTEVTDWFSFAVVTFRLYMGIHPYQGRHTKYSPKEIAHLKMMDDGVSVFHPDVQLPTNCQDWSVIPKPHLDWFKQVFLKDERSIPPLPGAVFVAMAVAKKILGNERFMIDLIEAYANKVRMAKMLNGTRYVITEKNVFAGKRVAFAFENSKGVDVIDVDGDPILGRKVGSELCFTDEKDKEISKIAANSFMTLNNHFYSVFNGNLLEHTFTKFSEKFAHGTSIACTVFENSYKLFKGVCIQDVLDRCIMDIPYKPGACSTIFVKELDGYRIVDAKYESGHTTKICVVLAEKGGKYSRFILCFDANLFSYTMRREDADLDDVNFVVTSKGLCIMVVEDKCVELFYSNAKIKVVDNPPFDSSMELAEINDKVAVINGKDLQSVTLK